MVLRSLIWYIKLTLACSMLVASNGTKLQKGRVWKVICALTRRGKETNSKFQARNLKGRISINT